MEVAAWVGALSGAAGVIVAVLAWRRAGRALRAAERRAAAAERRAHAEDRRFRAERSAVLGVRYSHGKAADRAIYCFVDQVGGSVALRVTPEEAAIGGKRFPIQSPEGGFTLGPGER